MRSTDQQVAAEPTERYQKKFGLMGAVGEKRLISRFRAPNFQSYPVQAKHVVSAVTVEHKEDEPRSHSILLGIAQYNREIPSLRFRPEALPHPKQSSPGSRSICRSKSNQVTLQQNPTKTVEREEEVEEPMRREELGQQGRDKGKEKENVQPVGRSGGSSPAQSTSLEERASGRKTVEEKGEQPEEEVDFAVLLDGDDVELTEEMEWQRETNFADVCEMEEEEEWDVVAKEEQPAAARTFFDGFDNPDARLVEFEGGITDKAILSTFSETIGDEWTPPEDEEAFNRMQTTVPLLYKKFNGDILVTDTTTYGPAASFSADTALSDTVRLSSAYAKSIPRIDLLVLLAPAGYTANEVTSLETRWKVARTFLNAVQQRRLEAFAGLIIRWFEFCEKEKVAVEKRFPADHTWLYKWLGTLRGVYCSSYIRTHLNALQFLHHLHLLPFNPDNGILRHIITGAGNIRPPPREDRRGLTIYDLIAIYEGLQNEAVKNEKKEKVNAAIWAALVVGFFGMCRVKDITLPRATAFKRQSKKHPDEAPVRTFDPNYDAHGGSFQLYKETSKFPSLLVFTIPYDKIRKQRGAKINIAEQSEFNSCLDPVAAVKVHIALNEPSVEDPAFSYYGDNGQRRWLTRSFFVKKIGEILREAGRDNVVHGHSMRIGGANFFKLCGVDVEIIKSNARWASSASWRVYQREKETTARTLMANRKFIQEDNEDNDEDDEE
ncbi:hypothetical protein JCM11641_002008 [Rhodosporidiobolus odoratus]